MYQNGVWTAEGAIEGMDSQITEIAKKGREMAQVLNDSVSGYIDSGSLNTTHNYDNSTYSPNVIINITQRDGEDANTLAKRVSEIINNDVDRKRAAWR